MGRLWSYVRLLLLALALLHALSFGLTAAGQFAGRDGLLLAPHTPLGGDFINLFAAAQLTLAGRVGEIFDPALFAAHQATLLAGEIGVRLWAYPPTSLFLAAPFGLVDFLTAFVLWGLSGLLVLGFGARRIGLGWIETIVLLLSPGALHSVYFGQTGNIATGLLLCALAGPARSALSGIAAGLLTFKPQVGFLVALDWLLARQWRRIGIAAVTAVLLAGLSIAAFGTGSWSDYLGKSLPFLQLIEREATGPLLHMIPSVFIAGRVLGLPADTAFLIHLLFAASVAVVLVWQLWRTPDPRQRAVLVLLATPLISPYLHSYDLALVAAGALLLGRQAVGGLTVGGLLLSMLVVAGWGMPNLLLAVNRAGVPVIPLLALLLFIAAAFVSRHNPDTTRAKPAASEPPTPAAH